MPHFRGMSWVRAGWAIAFWAIVLAAAARLDAQAQAPSAVSVSPSSGNGSKQTFTFVLSDPAGWTNLNAGQLIVGPLQQAQSCYLYVVPTANTVYLADDTGAFSQPLTIGASGLQENSQCALDAGGSSSSGSGTTWTVNLALLFKPAFANHWSTFMWVANNQGLSADWVQRGTWTTTTTPAMTTVSVNPSSGTGMSTTLSQVYYDTAGGGDVTQIWTFLRGSWASPTSNACFFFLDRPSNKIYMDNDAGSAFDQSATIGQSGTLSNSQCSLDVLHTTVSISGNALTLTLPITFKLAFSGAQQTWMSANNASQATGWRQTGTWTVATLTNISVSPSSGSGSTVTLSEVYSDSAGANDITEIWTFLRGSFVANPTDHACFVHWIASSNQVQITNDAGSFGSPVAVGTNTTLSNGQCTLDVSHTSVSKSGNNLTLTLPLTFTGSFAGTQQIFMSADDGIVGTGWLSMGTWTVPTPWYSNTAWTKRKQLTISHANVSGSTNLNNFPLLVSFAADSDLASGAQANGNDILFTAADGVTKLNHEIETYNGTTGQLIAWVQVPTLSPTTDTTIYLYYGNGSASNQQNATGVWDSNYKGVWHLSTGTALSANDSTSNANNGTLQGNPAATSGQVGGAGSFNGSDVSIGNPSSLGFTGQITLEAWVNVQAFPTSGAFAMLAGKGYDGTSEAYYFRIDGTGPVLDLGSYNGANHNATWTISGWNTSSWHHVVGLYDGSNWAIYFDGVQKAIASNATGALTSGKGVFLAATEIAGTVSRYLNGYLDEVRVSAIARSAGWIATEYSNQSAPGTFVTKGSAQNEDDFTISLAQNSNGPFVPGNSVSYTITTTSLNGFSGNVSLAYSGPTTFTPTLGAASIPANGSTQLTLTIPQGTPVGTTPFTITGISSNMTHVVNGSVSTSNAAPSVGSVSPANGSGSQLVFSFVSSDPNGGADITQQQLLFQSSDSPSGGYAHACDFLIQGTYIYLLGDQEYTSTGAVNWGLPVALGANSTLSNSQCSFNAATSSQSVSGTNITLNLAITFTAAYTGAHAIYTELWDNGGFHVGPTQISTFTVSFTAGAVPITITTAPAGLSVTVDGTVYPTSPQTFQWLPQTPHTIGTTSSQTPTTGTQYIFSNWSNGPTGTSQQIATPSSGTTYTANFSTRYFLTTAAGTGGTISPGSGWYPAQVSPNSVAITATPSTGYQFSSFTGDLSSTTNPGSITMTGPKSVTANFTATASAPAPITVTTSPTGLSVTVDQATCLTPCLFQWTPGSSHSISTSSQQGTAGTQYVSPSWSVSNPQSITAPSSATTYTASFTTQYYLTTSASAGGSISPGSGWYNSGQLVTLSASASSGYQFTGFSGDIPAGNGAQISMNAPHNLTANFSLNPANNNVAVVVTTSPVGLTVLVDNSSCSSPCQPTWTAGSSHSIAVATSQTMSGTSYTFAYWSDGQAASHSVTAPGTSATYTATFNSQSSGSGPTPSKEYIRLGDRVIAIENGGTPTVLSISPPTASLQAGQSVPLTANQQVTWSQPATGSLSTLGPSTATTYTAPSSITSQQTVTITGSFGGSSAQMQITLQPPPFVTLTPTLWSLHAGQTSTITANQVVSWQLTGGVGSISSSGPSQSVVYTPPSSPGSGQTATITASAGGVSANVTLTLVPTLSASATLPGATASDGLPAQFTFSGTTTTGFSNLNTYVYLAISPSNTSSTTGFGPNSCIVRYQPSTGTMGLSNDAGTGYAFLGAYGSDTVLQNSQCWVSLVGTPPSSNSTTVTVSNLSITFKDGFAGTMYVYTDVSDNNSDLFWPSQGSLSISQSTISLGAIPKALQGGATSTLSSNQWVNWAVATGPGDITAGPAAVAIYHAPPAAVTGQTATIMGTSGISSAQIVLTLLPTLSVSAIVPSGTVSVGTPAQFSFTGSTTSGFNTPNDTTLVGLMITPSPAPSATGSCILLYQPSTQTLWLADDNGSNTAQGTFGSGGILSNPNNHQCTVSLAGTPPNPNSGSVTLSVSITFLSGFTGAMNVYVDVDDNNFQTFYLLRGAVTIQ